MKWLKWNISDLKVVDKGLYYSVGHLCIPAATAKSHLNISLLIIKSQKTVTCQQVRNWRKVHGCYDISGDKMQLILDLPTIGEPHYALWAVACQMLSKKIG